MAHSQPRLDRRGLQAAETGYQGQAGVAVATNSPGLPATLELREQVAASNLDAEAKTTLLFEIDAKISEFQSAFQQLLGLDLIASPPTPAALKAMAHFTASRPTIRRAA